MSKLLLAILQNELADDHHRWIEACRERSDQVDWEVIDLIRSDWLTQATRLPFDGLLAKPPAYNTTFKTLYDERVRILHEVCRIPVYPSLEEIMIYENKKYLSYWLAANDIPHPRTWVFYYRQEALRFLEAADFPVVAKSNIGASGRGVQILKSRAAAQQYVNDLFSGKGAKRRVGPNWRKKGFAKRVVKKLLRPREFQAKLQHYQHQRNEAQNDFVIFQAFVPHSYEWRCVRIGDSFFAHKKMVRNEKASGTLVKGYENPPLKLLDFIKAVSDKRRLTSQAIDVFETEKGEYLVNEVQCIFGQSDPYQMLVDGQPGRYRRLGGEWVFEPGDFNRYESYGLRLDNFIQILQQPKNALIS